MGMRRIFTGESRTSDSAVPASCLDARPFSLPAFLSSMMFGSVMESR